MKLKASYGLIIKFKLSSTKEDDLYLKISEYANELAERIREVLYRKQIPFLVENRTNQIFPILPDEALAKLGEKYCYTYQQRMDAGHSAVRFCTSWATKKSAVEALCADLREILA